MTTMRKVNAVAIPVLLLASVAGCGELQRPTGESAEQPAAAVEAPGIIDHTVESLSGETVDLASFRGRPMLIVNTASKCGNTPQYEGLEMLYEEYGDRGLVVLGFPSNDFFGQEPGTEEEIQEFCRLTYKVRFPMFEKTAVKEGAAHPFFDRLAAQAGTYPTWNFHKYLVGRDGKLIREFSPRTKPYDKDVIAAIEAALGS